MLALRDRKIIIAHVLSSETNMKSAASLTPALTSRLAKYSAAAAAGAVTISSSQAAIVYINYGNIVVADTNPADGNSAVLNFDIDQNGSLDMRWLSRHVATVPDANFAALDSLGGQSLGVVGLVSDPFIYPARLAASVGIGASAAIENITPYTRIGSLAYGSGFPGSQWAGAAPDNTGYLGIRFTRNAQQHYAWVRITVNPQNHPAQPRAITIHEGAYEDTPGADIVTGAVPEPTGLGLLALGSIGLTAHRRRRIAAAP